MNRKAPYEGAIHNQSWAAMDEDDSSIIIFQTKTGWNVLKGRELVASSVFFSRAVSFVRGIAA